MLCSACKRLLMLIRQKQ
ncbi:hypothetical protein GN157_00695 [Flavobacterium rakeshii]|uniref:Uncharacterized protein n=1 Tax=Flavobacterium rakeshii TaxID=1038845 RepID=A0A6N8H9F3_9FLAO|nr:hypothetical protein [Flavobacterium rakeshii]